MVDDTAAPATRPDTALSDADSVFFSLAMTTGLSGIPVCPPFFCGENGRLRPNASSTTFGVVTEAVLAKVAWEGIATFQPRCATEPANVTAKKAVTYCCTGRQHDGSRLSANVSQLGTRSGFHYTSQHAGLRFWP